jgi:hypothetical protein
MGGWRALLVAACLATGGCFPREDQSIGAVDPMNSIPAIQSAGQAHDRKAVPALVAQLNNDDPAIRFYAFEALRRITGKTFDYRYYDDVDERRPAVGRWKQWLQKGHK